MINVVRNNLKDSLELYGDTADKQSKARYLQDFNNFRSGISFALLDMARVALPNKWIDFLHVHNVVDLFRVPKPC